MKKNQIRKIFSLIVATSFLFTSCSDNDDDIEVSVTTSLYASNNSNGNLTVYDVTSNLEITSKTLITSSLAADGIYYDSSTSSIFQASRSGNNLEGFVNVDALLTGSIVTESIVSSSDMDSPREVAVNGNTFVVADNSDVDGDMSTPDGRFFVYTLSNGSFTLRNVITVNFKVWGIAFIGNDLYAVVDADNELAVLTNFLSNTATTSLTASKRVVVEGIVRTHGLTYDAASNTMIMTDIGEASNGQDDGGFHVIANFLSVFSSVNNGGTLALSNQVRVSGSSTLLGNPVDVAYDGVTETVYIAEAGNGGGRILAFNNVSAGGNITPFFNSALASASSVYLSKE